MPSSYSSNLKIELQATGENSGTWGTITNTNLGTALEQAIIGYGNPSYASDANLTLTYTDTNAAQAARALVLNVTSAVSLTQTRELVVPTIQKQYIVQNNTTGSQSITVKTSGGTGITVPNGRKAHLYVNGTNVIYMDDFVDINGGAIDGTTIGGSSAAAGTFTTLTTSSTVTLNGGTANGVLYLNGSKVATSGSALTFNGSNLSVASGNLFVPSGVVTVGDTTSGKYIEIYNGTADAQRIKLSMSGTDGVFQVTRSSGTAPNFIFQQDSSELMRLTSTGLGIGTSSPSYKLDVRGTLAAGSGTIFTGFSWDTRGLVGTFSNHALGFFTNNTAPTMLLDTSGNLGVGTTSPGTRLDVRVSNPTRGVIETIVNTGSSSQTGSQLGISQNGIADWVIGQPAGVSAFAFWAGRSAGADGTEVARITSGGAALFGTTNEALNAGVGIKLRTDSTSKWVSIVSAESTAGAGEGFVMYSTGAAAYRFYVNWGGTIFATATTISGISDQRLKENVRDLDAGLAEVLALKPRKFDWKPGKGKGIKNDRGFIAQEFEQVFPDLIDEWKDPAPEGEEPYKSVRQDLIPVLVKAIQELKAELDATKAEVTALKGA